ncbi:transmembrane protein 177 isoform 1-T3 [Discoglossus pictus]
MASPALWRLAAFTQKHRGKLLSASTLGLFAANISYHVFPEQTFRTIYQGWSKGQPAELSDSLQIRFQQVLQEVQVGSPSDYIPFAAYGFHPVSAGVPWLPSGCLIGIPSNYNNMDENGVGIVDRVVMINGKEVDWSSEAGGHLRAALNFSVDAQKFSLAREVIQAQTNSPVIQASVAPACLSGICLSSVAIKQLLGFYSAPMLLRGLFNVAVAILGLAGYFLCYDAVNEWLDYRADKKVANISKSYAKGGLEFYEKILTRNKALRGLMGKQGEEMYAPSGNLFPKYTLRVKHAPYTARKDRIQRVLDTKQK